jgi:hypothetical protein
MYWKYGIAVEQIGLTGPEATNYESVVRMQLSWIEETDVGKLLFRGIARQVLDAPPHRLAKFNVAAQPGEPTRGVLVRPYAGGDCNAEEDKAIVWYSPYTFLGPCWKKLLRVTKNRGLYPQEVLFHELVHALRDASGFGKALAPLGGGLKGYEDAEEFISVVVTNIYMTDPSNKRADRVGLRRDHGFGKLGPELSDSLAFYQSSWGTFDLIEQFCQDHSWFTERLAEIKATFNPIAAYYHEKAEARSRSKSLAGIVRDIWMP